MRIAYLNWVCEDRMLVIVAADPAGRHREAISRPQCRHVRADELRAREEHSPAWAPDGRSLSFTRDGARQGVYVWSRNRERRVDATWVDQPAVWSPDGERLALATPRTLWLTNVQGKSRRTLVRGDHEFTELSPLAWAVDASRLMFIADGTLETVPAVGGRPRIIARNVGSAAWSPDGDRVAYTSLCRPLPGDESICSLFVVAAGGGTPRRYPLTLRDMSLAWDGTGDHLLVGSFDDGGLRIMNIHTGKVRAALDASVEFLPTTGPTQGQLRLVRIDGISLALLATNGKIEMQVVVPHGWSTDEVAAYVR